MLSRHSPYLIIRVFVGTGTSVSFPRPSPAGCRVGFGWLPSSPMAFPLVRWVINNSYQTDLPDNRPRFHYFPCSCLSSSLAVGCYLMFIRYHSYLRMSRGFSKVFKNICPVLRVVMPISLVRYRRQSISPFSEAGGLSSRKSLIASWSALLYGTPSWLHLALYSSAISFLTCKLIMVYVFLLYLFLTSVLVWVLRFTNFDHSISGAPDILALYTYLYKYVNPFFSFSSFSFVSHSNGFQCFLIYYHCLSV